MHLVEHGLNRVDVALAQGLQVKFFIVDEVLCVFGLSLDHPLNELDSAFPLALAAEALNLTPKIVEDLYVDLRNLQAVAENRFRIIFGKILVKCLTEVLHLLENFVGFALFLYERLGTAL